MAATIMSGILLTGMLISGGAVITILLNKHENTMREFAALGLFCALLAMSSYYIELHTTGIAAKVTAVKFGYLGKVFANPMLMMLAVRFYRVKMRRTWQTLMYVIPVVTLYLIFNCETNNLYYSEIGILPNGLLRIVPGPMYYVYIAYNTILALLYLGLVLYQRKGLQGRDLLHNTLLLLANVVPFLSLMIYLSGWTKGYDISTVGVMIGSLLVTIAIFRFGLLNKEEMLQNMATGLIFLDSRNHLIYANCKALQLVPVLGSQEVQSHQIALGQLCEAGFDTIQVGKSVFQRKITEWSNDEGEHGKLLTFEDITEMRARLNRDAMTGLLNHATFYPTLENAMAEAGEHDSPLAVSIADIDSFKYVNDTYGHANGDTVLIALAETLQDICEPEGFVFRYGGEEFAVIFQGDYQFAEKTMQKALDAFSAKEFDFLPYHVTFSFGSAEFDRSETSVALFDRADQQMYARKRALHEKERAEGTFNGRAPEDAETESE